MVTLNKRFELDDEKQAQRDAEYWRLSYRDEVRFARVERYAAFLLGIAFGVACTFVAVLAVT